jgi:hypothetical protein
MEAVHTSNENNSRRGMGHNRDGFKKMNRDFKSMTVDENGQRSKKDRRFNDDRRKKLGTIHPNKGNNREPGVSVSNNSNDLPRKLLSKSLDCALSESVMRKIGSCSSFIEGGVNQAASEAKGYAWDVRRSHEFGMQHNIRKSEFAFDLTPVDEGICRQMATMAYNAQNSLECDFELARCLQMTFIEHDRILTEHAGIVQANAEKARERAVSDWLKSRTKEEQMQYLSHYGKTAATAGL